jgi:hypothetical protein
VTRLDDGRPLRQVLITLTASGQPNPPSALTDDNGRFELAGLPPASYTITASKGGFVTLQHGQRRPYQPGRPIELAAAAIVERIDFALSPGGVVTGRIVDEDGDAVANVTVQVLRQRYSSGRTLLSSSVAVPDATDDRGEFRIYGIPPGTYYVSATRRPLDRPERSGSPPSSSASSTSTSFYPGSSSPDAAQPITVAPGQEIEGLSFSLAPAAMAKLTVLVRTVGGQPLTRTPTQLPRVQLNRVFAAGGGSGSVGSPIVSTDGSVSWANLPPGEYGVSVTVQPTGEAAATRVTMAGADVKVELTPQKADIARGRITFDADAAPGSLRPEQIRIAGDSPDPLEGFASAVAPRTNADWTFETGVTQSARLLRASLPAGWVVKSIRMGDADVTDTPLPFGGSVIEGITILVTDRLTEVSGVVRDEKGTPVDDATVVLFGDDPGRWRYPSRFVASVRADRNGRFSRRGLPPARYVAVALDYLEAGEETNPELLRRLQAIGARFELEDRETTTIDLALSPLP